MVFGTMAATHIDFQWLGFQFLDPIQNLDHLQTKLFLTTRNQDMSRFQIPTIPLIESQGRVGASTHASNTDYVFG